jgi:hypothetical protein
MSHSTKLGSLLKKSVLTVAGVVAAFASIFYVQEFAKIDPLVNMRHRGLVAPDQMGIQLGKVHLVQYRGDKKISEADVDKVFIPSDRSEYELTGVTNGLYLGEKGKQFRFAAPVANWDSTKRVLVAEKGTRIWNKDLDLKTALFRINEREQTLYVPGKFGGRFYGGKATATNLLYRIREDVATVGPTHWDGNLALSLQDEAKPQSKRWEFDSANGTFSVKGDLRTWNKGTATDGDIIIQADKIEHNNKTDVVTATGKVRYFSTKANVSCEKAVIFRKEKRAVLTGAVDMLVKPKNAQTKAAIVEIPPFRPIVPAEISTERPAAPPVAKSGQDQKLDDDVQSPKTLRDYPLAITAAKIEYWYGRGNRHAIITGDPQARQELPEGRWRHMWAFQAFYDGEKETLKMDSRPGQTDTRLQTSLGDDVVAEEVVVSTKEDDEDMDAKGMKGKIYGKVDEDDGVGVKPPDPIKPPGTGGGKTGGGSGGLRGNIRS